MNNLKDIRKKRGLSQRQLAAKSGCSYGFLSDVENGRSNPTIYKAYDLAAALKVSLFKLFPPKESSDDKSNK